MRPRPPPRKYPSSSAAPKSCPDHRRSVTLTDRRSPRSAGVPADVVAPLTFSPIQRRRGCPELLLSFVAPRDDFVSRRGSSVAHLNLLQIAHSVIPTGAEGSQRVLALQPPRSQPAPALPSPRVRRDTPPAVDSFVIPARVAAALSSRRRPEEQPRRMGIPNSLAAGGPENLEFSGTG